MFHTIRRREFLQFTIAGTASLAWANAVGSKPQPQLRR